MKATFIDRVGNRVNFSMDFSAEEFEAAQVEVYKKTKQKFQVAGFRRGKAPRKLIECHYGQDVFFEEAMNDLITKAYPEAIDELGVEPVDLPSVDFSEVAKGKPVAITVGVTVEPVVEVKDYKGVRLKAVSHPVTDEDVEGELETLRERNSRLVVSDKPAADGDTLLIDYAGYIDGEAFEGGTAEKHSLKLGSGDFIPGFEEQLVGAAAGDEREVSIKFPEDYFAGRLAGKDALFKCKVIGVKSEEKPELDDEFAQEASEFDTMDELRSKTRERLESAASAKSEFEMKNSLLEQIYKANEIDIPDAMVETQIDELVDELNQRLRYQGMDVDGYLKYTKRDMKGLRDGMREDAFKKVKTRLIVRAIADAEGMQASEDEIDKEISDMAKQLKTDAGKLRESLAATHMKLVKEDIRNRKAIDFLYASAEIDYSQKTG